MVHGGSWWLMVVHGYVSGWWGPPTPLKNDGVKVSWDDDIPNIWKHKSHVPNHQPGIVLSRDVTF